MRTVRWAVVVAAVCLAAAAAAVAYAAGRVSALKVVQAQRFELVDVDGRVRGVLGLTEYGAGGPALALYDGEGREAVSLAILAGVSPQLSLGRAGRGSRVVLGPVESSYGYPALILCGENGKVQASLEVVTDGAPALRLMDNAGHLRASVRIADTGAARSSVVLLDAKDKVVWQAP